MSILQKKKKKTNFFYFTQLLQQSTHISLFILNIYFIKIFILLHFLLWQEIGIWQEEREKKEINIIIYTKLQ